MFEIPWKITKTAQQDPRLAAPPNRFISRRWRKTFLHGTPEHRNLSPFPGILPSLLHVVFPFCILFSVAKLICILSTAYSYQMEIAKWLQLFGGQFLYSWHNDIFCRGFLCIHSRLQSTMIIFYELKNPGFMPGGKGSLTQEPIQSKLHTLPPFKVKNADPKVYFTHTMPLQQCWGIHLLQWMPSPPVALQWLPQLSVQGSRLS